MQVTRKRTSWSTKKRNIYYLAKNEAAGDDEALGGGDIVDILDIDGDCGGGEAILDSLGGGDCILGGGDNTLAGEPGAECDWR